MQKLSPVSGDFFKSFSVYLYLEKGKVIFYTALYEDSEQVFFTPIGCDFYHAVAGFNWFGVDDANYVHDEVFVKIRHRFGQFFGINRVNDTVYYVNNYPVCHIYCGDICL